MYSVCLIIIVYKKEIRTFTDSSQQQIYQGKFILDQCF